MARTATEESPMPRFALLSATVAAALSLGLLAFGSGVAAAQDRLPACGAFPKDAASYRCHCDAGRPGGSVWGSDPYTGDSDVCTAARHAGIIGADGPVEATAAPGQTDYPGTSRNGVQTSGWGSYGYSYTFIRSDVMNRVGGAGAVPACSGFPADADDITCSCPSLAAGGSAGQVWGSGPYTADSDLCAAARHDGMIGSAGGVISAVALSGLEIYRGSDSNGVSSADWGSYGRSFVIDHNAE
jgi:hypothetical protein